MTNEEIKITLKRSEVKVRSKIRLEEKITWGAAILFLAASAICAPLAQFSAPKMVVGYAMVAIFGFYTAIAVGILALKRTDDSIRKLKDLERDKARQIWDYIVKSGVFGSPLVGTARHLNEKIKRIYSADPNALLLPLVQAVRLFDVYRHQRERREAIDEKLFALHSLRDQLLAGEARLLELGEERVVTDEIRRLDAEIISVEKLRDDILASYRRLEEVIRLVEQKLETYQLHRKLDQLSSRLPATPTDESEFVPESLEEIERQIGREIETYLRLERETDEHLR